MYKGVQALVGCSGMQLPLERLPVSGRPPSIRRCSAVLVYKLTRLLEDECGETEQAKLDAWLTAFEAWALKLSATDHMTTAAPAAISSAISAHTSIAAAATSCVLGRRDRPCHLFMISLLLVSLLPSR